MLSSPVFVSFRNVLRSLGLTQLITKIFPNIAGSEDRFFKSLVNVEPNSVIWDVGANVGEFSIFCFKNNKNFKIFAFEPIKKTFGTLKNNCEGLDDIQCLNFGLAEREKEIEVQINAEPNSATNSILSMSKQHRGEIELIQLVGGDELIDHKKFLVPNSIKIDVEGAEPLVLRGISKLIQHPNLEIIGIEVHFKLLKINNLMEDFNYQLSILKENGFEIRYVNMSHLIASRKHF